MSRWIPDTIAKLVAGILPEPYAQTADSLEDRPLSSRGDGSHALPNPQTSTCTGANGPFSAGVIYTPDGDRSSWLAGREIGPEILVDGCFNGTLCCGERSLRRVERTKGAIAGHISNRGADWPAGGRGGNAIDEVHLD